MTNFDLIREFPDHIGAVARLEFLAHDPKPETQWFIEDIDQHQSTRQVWQSSETDIVPKRHAGFSAFEPLPICAHAREIRLQFRGYGIGHRRFTRQPLTWRDSQIPALLSRRGIDNHVRDESSF